MSAAVVKFLTDRVPIIDPGDPTRSAPVCRSDSAQGRVLRDVNGCLTQAMCLLMELGTGRRVYTNLGPWADAWHSPRGKWQGGLGWDICADQSGPMLIEAYREGFPYSCAPRGFQRDPV